MPRRGVVYGWVIACDSRRGAERVTAEILALPLLGRSWRRAGKLIAVSVAIAGLAVAVAGGEALWNRFQQKDPFLYRREILGSTLQMIRQRPWTGFGLGAYATVYPQFATFDTGLTVDHAHNDWAEWTAEERVPMIVLMLSLAVATFRPDLRSGFGL